MAASGGARLMVGFPGRRVDEAFRAHLLETEARSVILFGRNVQDANQVRDLVAEIRGLVPWPLLIAVDQEGGAVNRIEQGAFVSPGARALGALPANLAGRLARQVGQAIGWDLSRMGIDLNLAPVVDLFHEQSRTGLELRSFGSDPDLVVRLAGAFLAGQRDGGIAGCIKHYPGLGVAAADPHGELPRIPEEREPEFEEGREVFHRLIEGIAPAALMTTHLVTPGRGGEWITGSRREVHDRLRGAWGFAGLILADCLEMGGAALCRGGTVKAVVDAARAGHDLLPVCHTRGLQREAARALDAALRHGDLDAQEHAASVARIEALASSHRPGVPAPDGEALSRRIARAALRVVADPAHLLPLAPGSRLAVIRVGQVSASEGLEETPGDKAPTAFFRRWREMAGRGATDVLLPPRAGGEDIERCLAGVMESDHVLFCPRNAAEDRSQRELLRRLGRAVPGRLLVCAMRDDRDLALAPPSVAQLLTHGERPEQWEVLAERLLGYSRA